MNSMGAEGCDERQFRTFDNTVIIVNPGVTKIASVIAQLLKTRQTRTTVFPACLAERLGNRSQREDSAAGHLFFAEIERKSY